MIDKSKFRFKIGDTIEFRGNCYKVKGYYFSAEFNDYTENYGYTIAYPQYDGSCHSYDEYGNKISFPKNSVYYISESHVEAPENLLADTRTLQVSLEEATQWYESNNPTLRSLALTAYTEDELKPVTYGAIASKVPTWSFCTQIPEDEVAKMEVYHKLLTLASYFNNGWRKPGSIGYFITKEEHRVSDKGFLNKEYFHKIRGHITLMQAGIVYFKSAEDAEKAYSILGKDEIEKLFK